MEAKARQAGTQARKSFEQGFDADSLGTSFGERFGKAFESKLGKADLGLGVGRSIDALSQQVDSKLAAKLKTQLPGLTREFTDAQNRLAEATAKVTAAEERVNLARENGIRKASIVLPLESNLTKARKEQEAATTGAHEAQDRLNGVMTQYSAASRSAFNSADLFTGLLAGAMVGGISAVVSGMEDVIELGATAFEGAVEGGKELADELVEIGEKYAQLNIQVSEFSGATGEALDNLKTSAADVFGKLDVAGDDTGRTIATLAQRLSLSGEPLDKLATHIERLEGRFKDLRADDVATAFSALGVSGADADNVLASWVKSAQAAGESTGALIKNIAGLGDTLRPEITNLTPEQLGKWLAEIQEKVPNAQKVITGLSTAEKEFAKHGMDFASGLREAVKELSSATSEADKEGLAEKLFGSRNWSGALDAANMYLDVVRQGPEALRANGDQLDEMLESWSDLSNKVEEFKHHIESAAAPFGEMATKALEGGLGKLEKWFDDNGVVIVEKIRGWGHAFINTLPDIQEFAAGAIEMLGGLIDVVQFFGGALVGVGEISLAIGGHFEDAKKLNDMWFKFANTDFDKKLGDAAQKIKDFKLPLDDMNRGLDDSADAAERLTMGLNNLPAPPQGLTDAGMPKGGNGNGWWWGMPSSGPASVLPPSGAPIPVTPGAPPPAVPPGSLPQSPGAPQGRPTAPGDLPPWAQYDKPSGYSGGHDDLWDKVAQAEASGNWANADTGHNGHFGGLQFSPSTWAAFGGLAFADRPDHATPEQQMIVADRTAFTGWGNTPPQGLGAWETITKGMVPGVTAGAKYAATGGESKDGSSLSKFMKAIGFGPKGKDSILSYYTPGEFVVTKDDMDGPLGVLVRAMHGGGRYFAQGGGLNTDGAQVDTIAIAEAVQKLFGIGDIGMYRGADGYNEHSSGEAADVMVGTDNPIGFSVKDFALANATNFGVEYAIWQNKLWYPDGHSEPYGADPNDPTQSHRNHVHIRTAGGGFPQGGGPGKDFGAGLPKTGNTSNTPAPAVMGASYSVPSGGGFGASVAGWDGGGGFGGGMPSDPTGMTPQQFEVWNNSRERQKALRDKSDTVDRLTQERDQLQNLDIPKAKQDLEDERKGFAGGDPAKLDQLNKELKRLTDRLDKINTRELPDAQSDLAADRYKANEPIRPSGTKDDGARDFGSKFLGGIAQSLGFPDVFGGKAPWNFGLERAIGRFATGFMQGMDGKGSGGMPGMAGLGSPTSFLDGLTGFKPPTNGFQGGVPQITGAPNTAPTPHMPNGPGPGAPSSPTVGGINIGSIDNSISVHPATDKDTVSGLQSLQNSSGRAQAIAAAPSFGDMPMST